jgi:hypothetical protein
MMRVPTLDPNPPVPITSTPITPAPTPVPIDCPSVREILNATAISGGEEFEDLSSYQSLAPARILKKFCEAFVGSQRKLLIDPIQRVAQLYALASIYFATDGDNWVYTYEWLENLDECSWYGVDCDDDGVVIYLRSNRL